MGVIGRFLRVLLWMFVCGTIGYFSVLYAMKVHSKEIHMYAHLAEEKQRKRNQIATERYRKEIQLLTRENRQLKKQVASSTRTSTQQLVSR